MIRLKLNRGSFPADTEIGTEIGQFELADALPEHSNVVFFLEDNCGFLSLHGNSLRYSSRVAPDSYTLRVKANFDCTYNVKVPICGPIIPIETTIEHTMPIAHRIVDDPTNTYLLLGNLLMPKHALVAVCSTFAVESQEFEIDVVGVALIDAPPAAIKRKANRHAV